MSEMLRRYVASLVVTISPLILNVYTIIPRFCAATGVRFVNNPLSVERPGVGVACLYLVFEGLFLFILTLLIQVCCMLCVWVWCRVVCGRVESCVCVERDNGFLCSNVIFTFFIYK